MSLTPDQASDSLKEIQRTIRRSSEAHQYANASPGFILWGVIWIIGYAGSDLLPRYLGWRSLNWLWFFLTIIGVAFSFAIGRHQKSRAGIGTRTSGISRRWFASIFTLWMFASASIAVLRPTNPLAVSAFIPLMVATVYALLGWGGLRFLYAGIAVAVLTLGGFFWLPQYFLLWMAAVGGGSLVLVGLWLRKV